MLTEIKNDEDHYFLDEQGRLQGEYKMWWPNGIMRKHCFYVDNKQHGIYTDWYDNGCVWEQAVFVNNLRHGEYKWFDDDGSLRWHVFYAYGIKISLDEIPVIETEEDRVYFTLKYNIPFLPLEQIC